VTSDIDDNDKPFCTGERTVEGLYCVRKGLESAIARALSYAPYSDMIWCETATPDLGEAREFADAVHEQFPNKLLAYNCSPSFNWSKKLDAHTIARFNDELADMGYKFQFVTLAGFHTLNLSMFELAREFSQRGMAAYTTVQERDFADEEQYGYRAVTHQAFVGAGYFDEVAQVVAGGTSSTTALKGSTEEEQFTPEMEMGH